MNIRWKQIAGEVIYVTCFQLLYFIYVSYLLLLFFFPKRAYQQEAISNGEVQETILTITTPTFWGNLLVITEYVAIMYMIWSIPPKVATNVESASKMSPPGDQ